MAAPQTKARFRPIYPEEGIQKSVADNAPHMVPGPNPLKEADRFWDV